MVEIEAHLGQSLDEIYKNAIFKAHECNDTVHFRGNGIDFYANKDSDKDLLAKYLDKCYTYDITELGPYAPDWSPEFIEKKEKEAEERLERFTKELEMERKKKEENYNLFKEYTKDITPSIVNEEEYYNWKNQSDHFYHRHCFEYAEDLMKYLQYIITKIGDYDKQDVKYGEKLIGKYDISGLQHSVVVEILKKYWKYDFKEF